jgi:hypothetical protein
MYKKGYKTYGIEIINTIWEFKLVYINSKWRLVFPMYYVKVAPFKYLNLLDYQLNTLILCRKYNCMRIIEFVHELKIKLMLDQKYEG